MTPEPDKIAEALKTAISTGAPYKLAFAVAGGLYWYLVASKALPEASAWELRIAAAVAIVFGALFIANIVIALNETFAPKDWISERLKVRRAKRELEHYLPFMTDDEKRIIGYLLYRKQKSFDADEDGGNAAGLLSRGIVEVIAKPGQPIDPTRVPMAIPDPLWEVFERHRDQFPYRPPTRLGEIETHPWRIPWMVR